MQDIMRKRHQEGFTLIELMATLGILALIVAIAVPAVGSIMNKADKQSNDASISMIEESGEMADLGGLAYDNKGDKMYYVTTLVANGYLNIEKDNPLYNDTNYVVKQSNGTFKFNGDISEGKSITFANTSTGNTGANTDKSSGELGGIITMKDGMYHWTVPHTGSYEIQALGAQGGKNGGKGAKMQGDFDLTKGEVLTILVGQQGSTGSNNGMGGGGTFVTKGASYTNATALIIAGGGGGWSGVGGSVNAVTSETGANATFGGTGGTGGNGGISPSHASAGGGFLTDGDTSGHGQGGKAFRNGGLGGNIDGQGGFGGGGSSDYTLESAGGGGYSGGGGAGSDGAGGGGGSYNKGLNQANQSGANTGHGKVVITAK